eukprot:COSAG01_NODE_24818_length_765_cov_1.337838_1_plen_224_part_01
MPMRIAVEPRQRPAAARNDAQRRGPEEHSTKPLRRCQPPCTRPAVRQTVTGRRAARRVCERGAAATETMKRKRNHTGSGQRPPRIDWGVRATAQDEPPRERCYIHPDHAGRVAWDILLVVLLAYVAVVVPLNVCFQQEVSVDSAQFWIDMVVDVAFVADIVLHFFTGVWDPHRTGVLETDRAQIARKYLRGWFCIDVLAVLPYSYLVMLVEDSPASGASKRPPG